MGYSDGAFSRGLIVEVCYRGVVTCPDKCHVRMLIVKDHFPSIEVKQPVHYHQCKCEWELI